jgi:hypothetical protein
MCRLLLLASSATVIAPTRMMRRWQPAGRTSVMRRTAFLPTSTAIARSIDSGSWRTPRNSPAARGRRRGAGRQAIRVTGGSEVLACFGWHRWAFRPVCFWGNACGGPDSFRSPGFLVFPPDLSERAAGLRTAQLCGMCSGAHTVWLTSATASEFRWSPKVFTFPAVRIARQPGDRRPFLT